MSAAALQNAVPGQIATAASAIAIADALAASFLPGAGDRDQRKQLPTAELQAIAASGLLAAPIETREGGAGLSAGVQADILRRLAVADPALAQTLLPHFVLLGAVAGLASPLLRQRIFTEVLAGARIGNALSERGTQHAWNPETRLARHDDIWRLDGRKYYATGALTADWIGVSAKDPEDRLVLVLLPRETAGITLAEDWTSFGQRATVSGTAIFEGVPVHDENVLPLWQAFEGPFTGGAFDQLLHAAIDIGIARAALDDAARFVRTRSRPWFEADVPRAAQEPELVARAGQIASRVLVLEAAFTQTALLLDTVQAEPLDDASAARASIAVAALKVATSEVAVDTASALFELAGTSATDAAHGLDRHWRNARTHTLHDPVRWKHRHIGRFVLDGILPPRHPLI